MSNIFKVDIKDTKMIPGASIVNFKHILHIIVIIAEFKQIKVG